MKNKKETDRPKQDNSKNLPARSTEKSKRGLFGKNKTTAGPNRSQIQEFLFQWINVLPENEAQMLHGIFALSTTTVRQLMIPLSELLAFHVSTPTEKLKEIVKDSNYSHVPVYKDRIDRLTGLVSITEILYAENADGLEDFVRTAYYVPETKLASDLLEELRTSEDPVAIVIDEHSSCVGFITLEDVLELIVGRIAQNHHRKSLHIESINNGTWQIDARASINAVNEKLGINIPKDQCDTIGGFVLKIVGRLPQQDEKIRYANVEFTVEEVFGYGIATIQAKRISSEPTAKK